MSNYFLRKESGAVFLCCGKAGCPKIAEDDEGMITIEDDHGNKVKMKLDEAKLLGSAIESIEQGFEVFPESSVKPEDDTD